MTKTTARLSIVALLLAGMALARPASAACEYPFSERTLYYAWVDNDNPSNRWCTYPVIGPQCPSCLSWQVIGEIFVACDGTTTVSGDTTSCTASSNTSATTSACPPVCE